MTERVNPKKALEVVPKNPAKQVVDKISEKIAQGADPEQVRTEMAGKTNEAIAGAVNAAGEGVKGEVDEWLKAADEVFGEK